ncbi:hypothetical protein D9M70_648270 [compost metagenome]
MLNTQLWPIEALGSLPTCLSFTVNCLQLAGTAMAVLLNCIASLPSISMSQVAASTGPASSAVNSRAAVVFVFITWFLR